MLSSRSIFFFVLQNYNITLYIVDFLPSLKILPLSSLLVCRLKKYILSMQDMQGFLVNKTVCSHRAYSSGSIK